MLGCPVVKIWFPMKRVNSVEISAHVRYNVANNIAFSISFAVKLTMSLYTDSKSAQIGITTMFALLVTADLVGNAIVCLVIIIYHDMR